LRLLSVTSNFLLVKPSELATAHLSRFVTYMFCGDQSAYDLHMICSCIAHLWLTCGTPCQSKYSDFFQPSNGCQKFPWLKVAFSVEISII
jgi:hypothetical protein